MLITTFTLEGFNMPAVNSNGIDSDPYFNIYPVSDTGKKGGKIYRSHTEDRNLNPKWGQSTLPCTYVDRMGRRCTKMGQLPEKIIIEVKDDQSRLYDLLHDNILLGESDVLVVSKLKNGDTITLRDAHKEKINGYLKIYFPEGGDSPPQDLQPSYDLIAANRINFKLAAGAGALLATAADFCFPGLGAILTSLSSIFQLVIQHRNLSPEAGELTVFCQYVATQLRAFEAFKREDVSKEMEAKINNAHEALEDLNKALPLVLKKSSDIWFKHHDYTVAVTKAKRKTESALEDLMNHKKAERWADVKEMKSNLQKLLVQSEDQMKAFVKQYKDDTNQTNKLLQEVKEELKKLREMVFRSMQLQKGYPQETISSAPKNLIISTGDISDVDGFLAIAEYSKTGADVLFIMNYPGYIGTEKIEDDTSYEQEHPGMGYKYTAREVLENCKDTSQKYSEFMAHYSDPQANSSMKAALTDAAFHMLCGVWNESPVRSRGKCYFCVGGVNDINPFSRKCISNDVMRYAETFKDEMKRIDDPTQQQNNEGKIFDEDGKPHDLDLGQYNQIYMDFNGSMAFFTDDWRKRLFAESVVEKVKGVFVMGGVYDDVVPSTLPGIPGILNRFSSATMNQLYSPKRSNEFFKALARNKEIPVFLIANNVVGDISTHEHAEAGDGQKGNRTYDGVQNFLKNNQLEGAFLDKIVRCYYQEKSPKNRKPFDYYTALALTSFMKEVAQEADGMETDASLLMAPSRNLFFDDSRGSTFVSNCDNWGDVIDSYTSAVKSSDHYKEFHRQFDKEIEHLKQKCETAVYKGRTLEVKNVLFGLDRSTMKVTLELLQKARLEDLEDMLT